MPSKVDGVLVASFVCSAIAEAILRTDLRSPSVALAITLPAVFALLLRATRPLSALVVAYGVTLVAGIAASVPEVAESGLYTHACILLFPYSVARWASKRELAGGLAFVVAVYLMSAFRGEMANVEDAIGSAVVLLFPGLLGVAMRYRAEAERRGIEQATTRERELLARELHDTVAHHVAAIAIQAQGGRAALAKRPEAAASALEAIELEATRALAELRTLVGALRDDAAALAPRPGLADLERLVPRAGGGPDVRIERAGDLSRVAPPVEAAVYRVAQESITNAMRHARRMTRIDVRVAVEGDSVHLTVRDDGDPPSDRSRDGFGLVGMAERAALFGGTFAAGPGLDRGWTVDAVLPLGGAAR